MGEKLEIKSKAYLSLFIVKAIELLCGHDEVRRRYQERFKYVLIDEYQDTNRAQYSLIKMIAEGHGNICVVGDIDQSIYGWRGADIRNILDFEKDYPNSKTIKLEQNYRSTQNILEAANKVINNNLGRKPKDLWTDNESGEKIRCYEASNEHDESDFIVSAISKLAKEENLSYSSFAVLYRTNAQSRIIEEGLIKSGVPYKIVGGLKFYDRKEIKDIIAYLRVIQNPVDNISLKRIINTPKRGIGKTTLDKVELYSREREQSMYASLLELELIGVTNRASTNLGDFATLIGKFIAMKELFGLRELIDNVIDSIGYIEELQKEASIEARTRIENLEEFLSVIVNFEKVNPEGSLEDFLADIALLSDHDKTDEDLENTVTLMTMHSAKGLEYPYVFITGMEDGLFPSYRSLSSEDDLEEERRLCYVGITRAEKQLYMTFAKMRMLYGKTNYNRASRFIGEIPESKIEYLNERKPEMTKLAYKKPGESLFSGVSGGNSLNKKKLLSSRDKDDRVVFPGSKVAHDKWGVGTVVEVKREGDNTPITVAFENGGIKKLVLEYAPIQVL